MHSVRRVYFAAGMLFEVLFKAWKQVKRKLFASLVWNACRVSIWQDRLEGVYFDK